jgi:hypothetical protein
MIDQMAGTPPAPDAVPLIAKLPERPIVGPVVSLTTPELSANGLLVPPVAGAARPVDGSTPSPVVATSVPSMPILTANVPMADPPQPAAQSGTPKAPPLTPIKPITVTSADTTTSVNAPSATRSATPAVKKPVFKTRAKPSAIIPADHWQTVKTTKPLANSTKANVDADNAVRNDADDGAPLLVTPQGRPGRIVDASAVPAQAAQPSATPIDARANATGGSSFSIRLASSLSESDARATLSRLQKQFPGALGGGSIRRDDLGNDGVFYRVRVGPLSREAADKVCSRLKAAGKNCILTRS